MHAKKLITIGAAQAISLAISWASVNYIFIGPTPYIQAGLSNNLASLPSRSTTAVMSVAKNTPITLGLSPGRLDHSDRTSQPEVVPDVPISDASQEGGSTTPLPTAAQISPSDPTPTEYIPHVELTQAPNPTQAWRWPFQPSPTRTTYVPTAIPTRAPNPTQLPQAPVNATAAEQETVRLINQRRTAAGLGALSANSSLTKASREWSASMASSGTCGHDGVGMRAANARAKRHGYQGNVYGETVGCRQPSAESVVAAWWSSPQHKAILTNPSVRYVGVGWSGTFQTAMVGH